MNELGLDDLLARVAALAPLNAFIAFDALAARQRWRAQAAARAPGRLQGWALAIKDNIDLAGIATTAGSPALAGPVAARTASSLQRLLDAGAWVIGKTNMHELAFGVTSNNAAYGAVGNPRDPSCSAGGSSGGSAAAVAAQLAEAALGTDTGGSIRVPAAFCGLVGYRPSTGRYASDGVVPLARSRDTLGLLARSVSTVRELDDALTGAAEEAPRIGRPLRLGCPRGFFTDLLQPDIETAWDAARNALQSAGHTLIDVDVRELWPLIDQASPVVTAFELRRDFASQILTRAAGLTTERFVAQIASPDVQSLFDAILLQGHAPTDSSYATVSTRTLPAMRQLMARYFTSDALDAWIFPTTPTSALPLGANDHVTIQGEQHPLFRTTVRNLQQASLIGMPSLSMPMPVAPGALPAGLCVECLPGDDRRLLAIAHLFEGHFRGR